jgi:hypothetical protein
VTTAMIRTASNGEPTFVRVGDVHEPIAQDLEHPARSISLALAVIGYEIDGAFEKFSRYATYVEVRQSAPTAAAYLAGERRATTLGGLPRLVIDADLMVAVYPEMTLDEAAEYDAGEAEVRIR